MSEFDLTSLKNYLQDESVLNKTCFIRSDHYSNLERYHKDAKPCSVALILFQTDNSTKIVLMRRPKYEGVHSGQICFPGGKQNTNESLTQTAIRETGEEIGIQLDESQCLGFLSQLYIKPSNSLVLPVVFHLPTKLEYRLDPVEVDLVFELELSFLLAKTNHGLKTYHTAEAKYEMPVFQSPAGEIWGATAIMTMQFLKIYNLAFESFEL